MCKSKNNGVDPQDLIEKYGADTARLYTMFTAPPEATLEWNDAALEGSYRFLRRVWNFGVAQHRRGAARGNGRQAAFGKEAKALRFEIHTVLRQVDYDYQRMQYNTVVSGAMKLLNALEGFKPAATSRRSRRGARRLRHPAARAVPGDAAHRARALARAGLRQGPGRAARCALAGGRRQARWSRTRSSWCCRSTASCAARCGCRPAPTKPRSRRSRWPARPSSQHAAGAAPKRSSWCPAGWSTWCVPRSSRRGFARGRGAPWRWRAAASNCARRRRSRSRASRCWATSPFSNYLRRQLRAAGTVEVLPADQADKAEAVLEILGENRNNLVLSTTPDGQVRELQLLLRCASGCAAGRQGTARADRDPAVARHHLQRDGGAGQGRRGRAAVPRHAERHRPAGAAPPGRHQGVLSPPCSWRTAQLQPPAKGWRRSTPCTATSRCWRRRPPTRSAPRRAPRATPSAPCTPWPARTSTGARCWRRAARSACSPTSRSSRSASRRASPARTAAPRCSSSPRPPPGNDSTLTLVLLPRLDKATRSGAWFAALEKPWRQPAGRPRRARRAAAMDRPAAGAAGPARRGRRRGPAHAAVLRRPGRGQPARRPPGDPEARAAAPRRRTRLGAGRKRGQQRRALRRLQAVGGGAGGQRRARRSACSTACRPKARPRCWCTTRWPRTSGP